MNESNNNQETANGTKPVLSAALSTNYKLKNKHKMRKTPMIELRDKLLEEVQNLKEASQTNEHLKGYREALKNVANDIDAQMAKLEYKSIVNAYSAGCSIEDGVFTAVEKGIDFYENLYGKLS